MKLYNGIELDLSLLEKCYTCYGQGTIQQKVEQKDKTLTGRTKYKTMPVACAHCEGKGYRITELGKEFIRLLRFVGLLEGGYNEWEV